jgi:hypothetical protein
MGSKHIPGQWRLDHDGILMSIVDSRERVLADVFYGGRGEAFGDEVGEANGHLMAAAPELYDVVKMLLGMSASGDADGLRFGPAIFDVVARATDAIQKAEEGT